MSDEAADRAIHEAANVRKADLSEGAGVHVSDGHDGGNPPPKVDPFLARKALFAKSDAIKAQDSQSVQEQNPSVKERVQAMEAEARGEEYVPGQAPAPAPAAPPLTTHDGSVKLNYNGREVTVARQDVERAGGEELYLRQRHADDAEADLAVKAAAMAAEREKLRVDTEQLTSRQAEIELREQRGTTPPSQVQPARTGEQGPRPDEDADLEAQANELAAQIYSGDPTDAQAAIHTILAKIAHPAQQFTADQIANLAAEQLKKQAAPTPTPAPVVADPRWEQQRLAINAMAERDYPAIVKDPVLQAKAQAEIKRMCALPENRDRRVMDIVIQALDGITDVRLPVREMKQGLPVIPSAGGAAPVPTEEEALTGSSYVDLLTKRRRFGH